MHTRNNAHLLVGRGACGRDASFSSDRIVDNRRSWVAKFIELRRHITQTNQREQDSQKHPPTNQHESNQN